MARDEATGRIAIIDGANRRVLIWDVATDEVRAFGREGDGPGEFRRPIHIWASRGHFYVEDAQRAVLEVLDADGQARVSVRIDQAAGGGHGVVTGEGHFLASDPSGSGNARAFQVGEADGQTSLVAIHPSLSSASTDPPDHPLLEGTKLLRAGDEMYPRPLDLVFRTRGATLMIDQRRGLLTELDSTGAPTVWEFLPDPLVEDRLELFAAFAEEGRVSPITFFRQVASTPGDLVFLPLAGPQEEVLGWALRRAGSSWHLAPLILHGTPSIPPVETGVWLDDRSLLVGFGAGGGIGLLEVHGGDGT